MEWVETTSSTVEEASSRALDLLGVDSSDAEIEVLDEGKKGLFGRVKTEARVRARIKPKAPPQKEERGRRNDRNDRGRGRGKGRGGQGGGNRGGGGGNRGGQGGGNRTAAAGAAVAGGGAAAAAASSRGNDDRGGNSDRGRDGGNRDGGNRDGGSRDGGNRNGGNRDGRQDRNRQENKVEEEFTIAEQEEAMSTFVGGLATLFDSNATVSMVSDEENLEAQVQGDDVGLMIGPGGNTLVAVEELARTAMQRAAAGRRYHRIRVDVDGYKQRRREALGAFAVKLADGVKESGERKALEPMNSADRKVVHDALSDVDGVMTLSEGDDPRRYVVVAPTD